MSWAGLFTLVHVIAFAAWALLLIGPRGPRTAAIILYFGVGLLCLAYTVMFASQAGALRPADFMSIGGIKSLFARDGGVVLGWTHYLALDLFTGQWIAKDADHKGFSRIAQTPILILTLLAGPIGLLVWMFIRERRARQSARS
jgi:hypothetical protein